MPFDAPDGVHIGSGIVLRGEDGLLKAFRDGRELAVLAVDEGAQGSTPSSVVHTNGFVIRSKDRSLGAASFNFDFEDGSPLPNEHPLYGALSLLFSTGDAGSLPRPFNGGQSTTGIISLQIHSGESAVNFAQRFAQAILNNLEFKSLGMGAQWPGRDSQTSVAVTFTAGISPQIVNIFSPRPDFNKSNIPSVRFVPAPPVPVFDAGPVAALWRDAGAPYPGSSCGMFIFETMWQDGSGPHGMAWLSGLTGEDGKSGQLEIWVADENGVGKRVAVFNKYSDAR